MAFQVYYAFLLVLAYCFAVQVTWSQPAWKSVPELVQYYVQHGNEHKVELKSTEQVFVTSAEDWLGNPSDVVFFGPTFQDGNIDVVPILCPNLGRKAVERPKKPNKQQYWLRLSEKRNQIYVIGQLGSKNKLILVKSYDRVQAFASSDSSNEEGEELNIECESFESKVFKVKLGSELKAICYFGRNPNCLIPRNGLNLDSLSEEFYEFNFIQTKEHPLKQSLIVLSLDLQKHHSFVVASAVDRAWGLPTVICYFAKDIWEKIQCYSKGNRMRVPEDRQGTAPGSSLEQQDTPDVKPMAAVFFETPAEQECLEPEDPLDLSNIPLKREPEDPLDLSNIPLKREPEDSDESTRPQSQECSDLDNEWSQLYSEPKKRKRPDDSMVGTSSTPRAETETAAESQSPKKKMKKEYETGTKDSESDSDGDDDDDDI